MRGSLGVNAFLLGLLYTAVYCQQEDASAAIQSAAGQDTDQAVIDTFRRGEAPPNNLFNESSASAIGLAAVFNSTGPDALTRLLYTGAGQVAYTQEPITTSGAVNLGCGFGYVDPYFSSNYLGVGPSFSSRGFACGRCLKIQCDDASCAAPGTQVIAQIVDQCGETCLDADINIAYPLFQNISGRSPGSNPSILLSWEFVDCSPYINTTIKMLVKPGGTAYYQAFNFANSRQVIKAVQVNGQLLRHETSHWWSWNPQGGAIDPRGPFSFALLGSNDEVLRARLPQLKSADLGVQFTATVPPSAEKAGDEAVKP